MKRIHVAVIPGQLLSILLMITFIYANRYFGFLASWEEGSGAVPWQPTYVAACLVGIIGSACIWITRHYLTRSNSVRNTLAVCAWTRQLKSDGKWISFDKFLTEQLGFAVSHGLCDKKIFEMKNEIDRDWKKGRSKLANPGSDRKPMGFDALGREENRSGDRPASPFSVLPSDPHN
jgi:hypothetical protein